jgi:hydrogenase maturation protein HypF
VTIKAYELKIEGLVQGVGFRPFVYSIARREQITGWVRNSTSGVNIHIQATEEQLNKFIQALKSEAPLACEIHQLRIQEKLIENLTDFKILSSKDNESEITLVSPDIAVCKECMEDMTNQPHRINYPFTNCTHCGPRFSIVRELPYDRERTTMDVFPMCTNCSREYSDIDDRRFHAQPVACNDCGPNYSLELKEGTITKLEEVLDKLAELIQKGGIIAIKGMGGFFLMCDALNEKAVSRLRKSKIREGKPFAVLFRNIESVKKNALVSNVEVEFLESWQRPIVILVSKKSLAPSVSMGFPTIGVILPYMPVHYLIFERIKADSLVLTSGNLSDEPIIIDNYDATAVLGKISDAVLYYNRDIHNRVDDSVGFVVNGKPRLIRRSRGYVPSPVFLNRITEGILATGAELNNCFCIGKGNQAILSQHIGDLKNFETYQFYTESIARFSKLYRVKVSCAAYDMHPDYLSSSYAKDLDVAGYAIQHHHAHIAACMAENELDEPVIGVAMDGTGYGTDGKIWGSEFMITNLLNFERVAHFPYILLPGGDSVTKEPWRTGISVLHSIYGKEISGLDLPFLKRMDDKRVEMIIEALVKNINCPASCSAGRWFDAVAAITGICMETGFHSEAPMRLEASIDSLETGEYKWELLPNGEINFIQLITSIIQDIHSRVHISKISARFHNTIARIITGMIYSISLKSGIKKAVISGGSFQNKYLLAKLEKEFHDKDILIFTHSRIPSNDAGISLGQLAIAAKRKEVGW